MTKKEYINRTKVYLKMKKRNQSHSRNVYYY